MDTNSTRRFTPPTLNILVDLDKYERLLRENGMMESVLRSMKDFDYNDGHRARNVAAITLKEIEGGRKN